MLLTAVANIVGLLIWTCMQLTDGCAVAGWMLNVDVAGVEILVQ
jgi:hypothetical protein